MQRWVRGGGHGGWGEKSSQAPVWMNGGRGRNSKPQSGCVGSGDRDRVKWPQSRFAGVRLGRQGKQPSSGSAGWVGWSGPDLDVWWGRAGEAAWPDLDALGVGPALILLCGND